MTVRNYPFHFLLGFLIAFLPSIMLIKNSNKAIQTPQVLAEDVGGESVIDEVVEEEESAWETTVSFEAEQFTPSPSPTPTDDPTQKPTHTPSPTVELTPTAKPTATPEPTPNPVPTPTPDVWSPPEMDGWFSQYAGQYGVDKNILERLANCESHFNSNASNGVYLGMFQYSANTWSNYRVEMGFDPNPDLRLNPEESIRTAAFTISKKGVDPWPNCLR